MTGDMPDLKALIGRVAGGHRLSMAEAETAFDIMMSGNATPSQMGGFLMALRMRGETVDEIAGAAELVMGKTEGVPAAIVRGACVAGDGTGRDLLMPRERDLFR